MHQNGLVTEFHLYIVVTLFMVAFLNSNASWVGSRPHQGTENLMIVERLAALSNKQKDYRRPPEHHQTFGYGVRGTMDGHVATLEYVFPFLDGKESRFTCQMEVPSFSSVVSRFGVHTSCFGPRSKSFYELKSHDEEYLRARMNSDGFFFHSFLEGQWGVDFNHVIDISAELCAKIAHFIAMELQNQRRDSYINRVHAALNFVQYIPYGVPDFDQGEHCYFGLAIPHETLAISYSDCDSKSALFAGIVKHLIKHENVVLVTCEIESGGHMVVGVSDLPFQGQKVVHRDKQFLLLETTSPIPIHSQVPQRFNNVQIIGVKNA